MKLFILTLGLIFGKFATASTFVGNGGNAGDIELQMTLSQTQKTLRLIEGDRGVEGQNLCVCTERYEGRPLCDILKQLTKPQVQFCAKILESKALEVARIAAETGPVSYSWTHEKIEVQEQGRLRAVDAVTDAKSKTMTLNQERFLEMNSQERMFLVGHELFHLTEYEGKPLVDEGEIGPFTGQDGGRRLINALAATMVMQGSEYEIFAGYRAAERRSKAYKKTWVTLGGVWMNTPNDPSIVYDLTKRTGGHAGFRYQWTSDFGILGGFSHLTGEKNILSSSKAKEERSILSLGLAYRLFPSKNPLTAAGQSHFVLSGTVDFTLGKYQLEDPSVGTSNQSSSVGYTVACNYFIPFDSGLWGYGGVSYSGLNQSYNLDNQVQFKDKGNGTGFGVGVAYGF